MRFARIDLDRYGCFTGQTIEFGPASPDGDLHLVYGPNEAGKSTLRDACIDFLFGFPHQTKYGYLHANDLLQIGANVEAGGQSLEGRRIKRNKNSLLGGDGEPVSDAALTAVLGNVTRTSYEQMFSLDEDSLEAGGEEILRSEGDLGALLFSAASGLSSLSTGLEAIRTEAETFYRKSARNHRLNEAKDALKALQDRIREIDVQANTFERLRSEETLKRERHSEAKEARDRNRRQLDEYKSLLDTVEPWRELQAFQKELDAVADAPSLPTDWLEEAEKLVRREASAKSAVKESQRAVERIRQTIDAIDVDETMLGLAAAIKRLTDLDLEARYRTSQDIETRHRELQSIEQDIDGLIARLGRSKGGDASTLLLPAATVGTLQGLIEQRSGLLADEKTARLEYDDAEASERAAAVDLESIGDVGDLSALADQVSRAREQANGHGVEALEEQCSGLARSLDESITGLSPWSGDREALAASMALDVGILEKLRSDASAIQSEMATLTNEVTRRDDEKAELEAEIAAAIQSGGIVDDASVRDALSARDAAWKRHREGLDSNPIHSPEALRDTGNAFEAAMDENDRLAGTRLQQTSELSALRQAQTRLAKCEAAITRAQEKRTTLASRESEHTESLGQMLEHLGLPITFPLDAIDAWLAKRDAALSRLGELARTEDARDEARQRFDGAMASIGEAMANAGLDAGELDWRACLKRCDDAIADWGSLRRKHTDAEAALRLAKQETEKRKKRLEQAEAARIAWDEEWSSVLGETWIGEGAPSAVQEIVRVLDDLAIKLEKANALQVRIAAMKADRENYEAEVARLCTAAGEPFDDSDPVGRADALRSRASAAEEAARRRKERVEERDEAERRLTAAEAERDAVASRISEMSKAVAAPDLEALIVALKQSAQKARLEHQIERSQMALCKLLGAASFSDAQTTLSDKHTTPEDIDKIRAEHDTLDNSQGDEDAHVTALHHDWKTAEEALSAIGGDDEVARLEEQRQVLLLDIEQEAHAFMRLSAGETLVSEALRTYRETHRSSMMRHASDAFAGITRGAFRSLVSAPGKKGDVLVGVRRDGSSIVANEMSRGTRFQLYLALRIAGHAEFTKHRETLPFFADDVLEPFDDDRSAETFAHLSLMSKRGQVVYLTHHRHLCDLAKSVCGDAVTVHELPDRAVSGQ